MKKLTSFTFSKFYLALTVVLIFFIGLIVSFSFPDLFAMIYVPHFIFEGNIYSWVVNHKTVCPWVSATWPPLYYYSFGIYLWVLETMRLFPTHLIYTNTCPVFDLITDKTFLFWAKLPFLCFHLGSAWLFSQFFTKRQKLWFFFWLLNPIAIFINFMEGQFDSIPVFFFLLSLYYGLKKDQPIAAALALGIGGAYKHYPFLLLIPFTLILQQGTKKRLLFFFAAVIPYILLMFPELNKDFLDSLLFSENQKMFQSGISLGNVTISFYVILYAFFFAKLIFEKRKTQELLIPYSFLFSVIYFITTSWFSQRLLFLLPSLLLLGGKRKAVFYVLPILSVLFFIYTLVMYPGLFDQALLIPIFRYLSPMNYNNLPMETLKTYTFSAIIALLVWCMYVAQKEKYAEEEYAITKADLIISFLPVIGYLGILGWFVSLTIH